jgi:hypothetical protein
MGLTPTSDKAHAEPISPELVLVDPALRSNARTDLRPGGGTSRVDGDASVPHDGNTRQRAAAPLEVGATSPTRPPPDLSADAEFPDPGGSSHRPWRRRIGFVGLAALLCAGGVALARFTSGRDRATLQRHVVVGAISPAKLGPKTSGRTTAKRGGSASPRRIATTKPHARRTTRSLAPTPGTHQPKSARSSTSSTRSKRSVSPPSTRLFVWPAVKHAAYYKVQFFRRGHVVFEAWPTTARVELPLRWMYKRRSIRLVPAVYSWLVLPVFGTRSHPRYGDAIVRSKWIARL